MRSLNMKVMRTWAFNDGDVWQGLQTAPGQYNETVFRCDKCFTLAEDQDPPLPCVV